ncbi:MAG: metallophosphoesterase [Candidatus Altiarchaeota archaeon]
MIIGVLSDTHDNKEAILKAIELFKEKNVEMIIHAGDIVAPFTLEPFMDLEIPFRGVLGNNDGDEKNLNRKLEEIGTELTEFLDMECDGKKVAVYHGTRPQILEAIVKSRIYDIVASGHTHQPETTLDGNTLIVNPGETCGYLTGVATVAVVNTEDMNAEIHELK